MTVKEVRAAISGLPDNAQVHLHIITCPDGVDAQLTTLRPYLSSPPSLAVSIEIFRAAQGSDYDADSEER